MLLLIIKKYVHEAKLDISALTFKCQMARKFGEFF